MDTLEVYQFGRGASPYRAMLVDDAAWEGWRALDTAEPLAGRWEPPRLRFYLPGETGLSGDRKRKNPLPTDTDMPLVFGALMTVVSERFVSLAGDALKPFGEFLPCASADGSFFVYHCTNLIPALDEPRSEFSRSRSTGEILNVYRYAFREDLIPPEGLFRLENGNRYLTFCTGSVDALLRRLPLRGVRTEKIPRPA